MTESQEAVDLRYYRRWEIAAAKEETASPCAFVAAFFAAIAAHSQWGWWLWTVCAFAWVYAMCMYGYASDTEKAWREYERESNASSGPADDMHGAAAALVK
jgi:hypothetical protein